jgi:branched-chain amino acid transport system substrate-binding protein
MRQFCSSLFILFVVLFCVQLSVGCNKAPIENSFKVGIIAPMSGPGRSWGLSTYNAAKVIVDYHNEKGGLLIDGEQFKIELIVADDQLDPNLAIEAAHWLAFEEKVDCIIGPLGDDAAVAVAPILDLSSIAYVHYGFDPALLGANSSGILGTPIPSQALKFLYTYMKEEKDVRTISILANDTQEGIHQKVIADKIAREEGLIPNYIMKVDVTEEALNFDRDEGLINASIAKVVRLETDAVLLSGLPPENFLKAARLLRNFGYNGVVVAQNSQDPDLLRSLGSGSDDILFFGGFIPDTERTDYYMELTERASKLSGSVSIETDIKLYAMETLIRFIQHHGLRANLNKEELFASYREFEYTDPFFIQPRTVQLVGQKDFGVRRQISVPIIISEMNSGQSRVVAVAELSE